MAYTPTNWNSGDTVTAAKLNKLEQGVADAFSDVNLDDPQDGQTLVYDAQSGKWVNGAAGGAVLHVNLDSETGLCDKTAREILAALQQGPVIVECEYQEEYNGETQNIHSVTVMTGGASFTYPNVPERNYFAFRFGAGGSGELIAEGLDDYVFDPMQYTPSPEEDDPVDGRDGK